MVKMIFWLCVINNNKTNSSKVSGERAGLLIPSRRGSQHRGKLPGLLTLSLSWALQNTLKCACGFGFLGDRKSTLNESHTNSQSLYVVLGDRK